MKKEFIEKLFEATHKEYIDYKYWSPDDKTGQDEKTLHQRFCVLFDLIEELDLEEQYYKWKRKNKYL